MSINFEIKGLENILKRMEDRRVNMVSTLDAEMQGVITDINGLQKTYCPSKTDTLRAANLWAPMGGSLQYNLYNDVEYAPYVEFGTGGFVFFGESWVDSELEAYASQFKGKGIRKVNLYPQPFFFRAFFEKKTELLERLKKVLMK